MDDGPEDLTSGGYHGRDFGIPTGSAVIASLILALAGVMIGVLVPEITSQEIEVEDRGLEEDLHTLTTCTVDSFRTENRDYVNVGIPKAYYIANRENSNISGIDSITRQYTEFILGNETAYRLTISPGEGWDGGPDHSVSSVDMEMLPTDQASLEVLVDIGDGDRSITMVFALEIWEEE